MTLSLSMWSMHRTVKERSWGVIDFLRHCKRSGWDQVELLAHFWKDGTEAEQAADFARASGIKVVSYAVSNNFVSRDPAERQAALRKITDGIPVAQLLGTSTIRVFSGNWSEGVAYEEAMRWILEGLAEAAREAERSGVTLCLENHGKLAGRGEQVKEIIESVGSPALRSTFDTGNFLLVDEQPAAALEALLPYIAHVHFKDFKEQPGGRYKSLGQRVYEGVPAGEGDAGLAHIVGMLKRSGYGGAYVLEYEGVGSEDEGIRRSFANYERLVLS
ncbi:sugar phosphate isomerase/epimerase family protein [Paenibacillus sp. GYB003]|uniref:sugar phosphate isomerase/epimerase family protein n=1 Tax=Paenibacillus sp. GYB003 TaxID=2994392 RepID=UPI002F964704